MSATGIFELTAITSGSIQSDDVLVMVDVHDTAQAAQGSTRKTTLANLYQTQTTAVTVSTPLPNVAQTWNAAGVAFTAVKVNVTNTASAAGSLLLDLQLGGTSQFKVSKAGVVTTTGALAITGALTGATTGAFSGAVGTGALTVTGAATISTTLAVTLTSVFSGLVTAGDGTAISTNGPVGLVLGLVSSNASASAASQQVGLYAQGKQTAANSVSMAALEGYGWASHTSGTVALLMGVSGNLEVSGSGGTVTDARGITAGGGVVAAGATVTAWSGLYAASPTNSGTITTLYGLRVPIQSVGTTNWAIYCASSTTSGGVTFRDTALATNATVGFQHMSSGAGAPSGVPSPIPTGQIPYYYDSTNNFLYIYNGGWKKSTVYA